MAHQGHRIIQENVPRFDWVCTGPCHLHAVPRRSVPDTLHQSCHPALLHSELTASSLCVCSTDILLLFWELYLDTILPPSLQADGCLALKHLTWPGLQSGSNHHDAESADIEHTEFDETPRDPGLTCHWIRTEEVVCGVTETKLGGSPGTEIQGRRNKD